MFLVESNTKFKIDGCVIETVVVAEQPFPSVAVIVKVLIDKLDISKLASRRRHLLVSF